MAKKKPPRCGVPTKSNLGHEPGLCARALGHPGFHSSPAAYALKKKRNKELEVRRTYGVLPDEYDAMKAAQGGKCFLCRRATGKAKRLAVDHRHNHHDEPKQACRECVRGLLCGPCNTHLGWVEWVTPERILEYVNNPPAPAILQGAKG